MQYNQVFILYKELNEMNEQDYKKCSELMVFNRKVLDYVHVLYDYRNITIIQESYYIHIIK